MLLTSRPARAAAPPVSRPGSVLELTGAAFGYGRRPVLHGVDLVVHPGEVLAVRGPNGAGKSTLVRGLLGLAEVLAGEVCLFGEPRGRFRDWHRVGYVPQRTPVVGSVPVTVRELVSTGRLSRVGPWRRFGEADRCAVDCALEGAGLAGFDRRPVAELSGGQQRRALVARALAGDPELLVLDEPTAGVDADNQRVLAATLAGLAATGTAVVVVVHETGPLTPVLTRTVTVGGTPDDDGC
ncbi:ATP-binding cassette domain-containing protein [Modestobacter sp. VKM Ac-2986]|uniref:metal ABC transporter ATP-binding protein n=1 Tax=Modestobacter sp. VKM Ac-2986 TaxID=3004140 RepID=UPI0022ABA325|nr:ATP-binding cassette domain-containing protein [Modestobacter sp. VKM Ac-2986]MCZ2829210.1 ATP-binding cassette domain-containing protein [Modestobacter sp. VKM Ac-2986]